MSDVFPIKIGLKPGNVFTPWFFSSALDYAIRRVQVNQDGFKLNGTHRLLFTIDVNILGGSVHIVKKKHRLSSSY